MPQSSLSLAILTIASFAELSLGYDSVSVSVDASGMVRQEHSLAEGTPEGMVRQEHSLAEGTPKGLVRQEHSLAEGTEEAMTVENTVVRPESAHDKYLANHREEMDKEEDVQSESWRTDVEEKHPVASLWSDSPGLLTEYPMSSFVDRL